MLSQPAWTPLDPEYGAELLEAHPWVTLVSVSADGPVASHLPVVVEHHEGPPGFAVLGHLPKSDAAVHKLGSADVLIVAQGPHGYISPGWFQKPGYAPTWDYTAVHITGRPGLLDDTAAHYVLHETVRCMERVRDEPWELDDQAVDTWAMIQAVTAFRLVPAHVRSKAKLGQQRPQQEFEEVLAGLSVDRAYANHDLARAIREHRPTADRRPPLPA